MCERYRQHLLVPTFHRPQTASYPRTVSTEHGDGPEPLKLESASVPELVAVWLNSLDAFTEVALKLTATAWNTPSPCPGWTAGDVVAHVLSLESEMHGDPLPDHEPDWAALPHVTNDFSRYTEVPVDWYRSKGRDVVLAEPNALIGFGGPRVIEQTVRETLPEGFQRAEFLLEKGAIDQIVDRREMKQRICSLITLLRRQDAVNHDAA